MTGGIASWIKDGYILLENDVLFISKLCTLTRHGISLAIYKEDIASRLYICKTAYTVCRNSKLNKVSYVAM